MRILLAGGATPAGWWVLPTLCVLLLLLQALSVWRAQPLHLAAWADRPVGRPAAQCIEQRGLVETPRAGTWSARSRQRPPAAGCHRSRPGTPAALARATHKASNICTHVRIEGDICGGAAEPGSALSEFVNKHHIGIMLADIMANEVHWSCLHKIWRYC